jgi:hypothetical protein
VFHVEESKLLSLLKYDRSKNYLKTMQVTSSRTPLLGRELEITRIVDILRDRFTNYDEPISTDDRTSLKVAVLTGLPGTGKTRLLESHEMIMKQLNITNYLPIVVKYYNGHSLTIHDEDDNISIEESFTCRLLYRFFFDSINAPVDFVEFMNLYFSSDVRVSLTATICAMKEAFQEATQYKAGAENPLAIYLGVDEYQAIPESKINPLLDVFLKASLELKKSHIILLPVLAGTEWGKIKGLGSSSFVADRVPIKPFNFSLTLSLSSFILGDLNPLDPPLLTSAITRNCLYSLGGVPRFIIKYWDKVLKLENFRDSDALRKEKINVLELYAGQNKQIDKRGLILLVAYSFAHVPVENTESSGISLVVSKEDEKGPLTWQQLSNRGLVMLQETDVANSSYVLLPFHFLEICAGYADMVFEYTEIESLFLNQLTTILRLITVEFETDPWRSWEKFGALYYTLKINALLLIGKKNISLANFLHDGRYDEKLTTDLDTCVDLQPCRTVESHEKFNLSTSESYSEKGNFPKKNQLLDCKAVFSNAEFGSGIDIFFALRKSDNSGYVIILDQRKKEAKKLGEKYMKDLSHRITKSIPEYLAKKNRIKSPSTWNRLTQNLFGRTSTVTPNPVQRVEFVNVIFSTWGIIGEMNPQFPPNTCVFGWKQITKFLMPFTNHPAVTGMVDVNVINQSLLQSLLNIGPEDAKAIISERAKNYFRSFEELKRFLSSYRQKQNKKEEPLTEDNLHLLFFVDDYTKGK